MALAEAKPADNTDVADGVDVERFLEGLRHAWNEGEIGPGSRRKPSAPRGRRRPAPLPKGTDELLALCDADMAQTGRELLSKLQLAHREAFRDGLRHTVQRRLKIWRAALARELVFGASPGASQPMTPGTLRDVKAWRAGRHQDPTVVFASPTASHREDPVEATA